VKLLWFEEPWEDYVSWQQGDAAVLEKINGLLKDISREIRSKDWASLSLSSATLPDGGQGGLPGNTGWSIACWAGRASRSRKSCSVDFIIEATETVSKNETVRAA
jgi:hypothetical protein